MNKDLIYRLRNGEPSKIVDFWLEVEDGRVELIAERAEETHTILVIEHGIITVTTAPEEVFEHFGLRTGLRAESGFLLPRVEDDEETDELVWLRSRDEDEEDED